LLTGHDFFAVPGEPLFSSEDEERAAWQRHRAELLASNDFNSTTCVGMRPPALWRFDYGLKRVGWPREFDWPKPVQSEREMIWRELKAGRLAPNVPDELAQIEAGWLKAVQLAPLKYPKDPVAMLSTWHGAPRWFTRKHLPKAIAEYQRAAAKFRASLMGNGAAAQ
jgi:hypothetical protein